MGVKQQIKEAVELVERGLDKNIRICVTGLSGAGKTAFITSLVNQLLHQKASTKLPFWLAHAEKRIMAVKLIPYKDLHIPEFPYTESLESLDHKQWPASTRNISQIRLSVKYEIKNKWIRKLQKTSHLNIDLIDYPGEWLLDLPLLNLDYENWCRLFNEWLSKGQQSELADQWLSEFDDLESADLNKANIKALSEKFREFLLACKSSGKGIEFIQPGRFVLPGDLEGAPVLDFFPVPNTFSLDKSSEAHQILAQRFNYYRDQVVQPFFKEYFSKVDRQVLLVDVLKVLNQGYDAYKELQQTLSKLVTSFNYGQTNWLKRMFKPQINKLIIAATKSDQVPPEQHNAMKTFLSQMLVEAENQISYQGVSVNNLVFSAIQVAEPVTTEHQGKTIACIKGIELGSNKEVVNFPGKIPVEPMTRKQWKEQEYNFVNFAIPELATNQQLPHQRMDRLIELLVGDKFL
ncbi:MAG: YcjX family protein [Gammaproteobacteria bacterium]|nr:YcjX family protein [Gammaproteobacteria bacterium]